MYDCSPEARHTQFAFEIRHYQTASFVPVREKERESVQKYKITNNCPQNIPA